MYVYQYQYDPVNDLWYALQSMTSSDPEIVHPGLFISKFKATTS